MKRRGLVVSLSAGALATLLSASAALPRRSCSRGFLPARARAIAVHLLSGTEAIGSGTLIERRGDRYIAVTNAHVFRSGRAPYRTIAPDGRSFSIRILTKSEKDDIALFRFDAPGRNFPIARIGRSGRLREGETVYALGFPLRGDGATRLYCRAGRIVTVLAKALEGGYQIGYTNAIERGMSGGPLLDRQGELVGINGLKADPLWSSTEYYEDGSRPAPELRIPIERSSWAIPVERFPRP